MVKHQVVITDFIQDQLETEKGILGDIADVTALGAQSESDLKGRIDEADAVLLYVCTLTSETLDRLQNCRIIIRCGVGYDNVDFRHARRLGIPVANVPDYATEEVADSALGLTLTLTRGIALFNSSLREQRAPWSYRAAAPLRRLRGRVFGIVGLGRIGTAVAMRAKALGMKVLFYDPYKPPGHDRALGIEQVERLEELLSRSFIVSLHCPLTEETRGMIDKGAIARMPQGSYLINTARGAIVETSVIPSALESGALAGVGIDVLKNEPPPDDDPLISAWRNPDHPAHDRALLNPHSAFYSEDSLVELREKAALTCRKALCGEPVGTIVN